VPLPPYSVTTVIFIVRHTCRALISNDFDALEACGLVLILNGTPEILYQQISLNRLMFLRLLEFWGRQSNRGRVLCQDTILEDLGRFLFLVL
jgi:hypothetical protein